MWLRVYTASNACRMAGTAIVLLKWAVWDNTYHVFGEPCRQVEQFIGCFPGNGGIKDSDLVGFVYHLCCWFFPEGICSLWNKELAFSISKLYLCYILASHITGREIILTRSHITERGEVTERNHTLPHPERSRPSCKYSVTLSSWMHSVSWGNIYGKGKWLNNEFPKCENNKMIILFHG